MSSKTVHHVLIDSRDRDEVAYPEPNKNRVRLARRYHNVISARLLSISLPFSFCVFSAAGVYGQGDNWTHDNGNGYGGSGGSIGSGYNSYGGSSGGGGGAGYRACSGGNGAVWIIWGFGRAFPSTNVTLAMSTSGETTV